MILINFSKSQEINSLLLCFYLYISLYKLKIFLLEVFFIHLKVIIIWSMKNNVRCIEIL